MTPEQSLACLNLLDWVFQGQTVPEHRDDLNDAYFTLYEHLHAIHDQREVPSSHGKASQTLRLLRVMKPNERARIHHKDISCNYPEGTCSLYRALWHLKQTSGWEFDMTHEAQHVAIVERIA